MTRATAESMLLMHTSKLCLPQLNMMQMIWLQAVLRQLTANSCHGLASVTIQLPSSSPLESLSVTGCRKLKLVYIAAPQLRDLSVDSCPQLTSLELQCPNLTMLSASKCGSLTGLAAQFECPALQQLNLFGCRQLQTEGKLLGLCCHLWSSCMGLCWCVQLALDIGHDQHQCGPCGRSLLYMLLLKSSGTREQCKSLQHMSQTVDLV